MNLLVTFSCGHAIAVKSYISCEPGQEVMRCPYCPSRRGVSEIRIEKASSKLTRELAAEVRKLYDTDYWRANSTSFFDMIDGRKS